MNKEKPVLIAITAASGVIYGIKTLEFLLKNNYQVELIISQKAYYIAKQEIGLELSHDSKIIKKNILDFLNLLDKEDFLKVWLNDELYAAPSSGSYKISAMIISPASMASIAAISTGYAETLITRTADVMIKERRNLIIVPRETPFSSIHLENMLKLSNLGVKIVPPIIGFYGKIQSIDDCINFVIGKILDACDIPNKLYERWYL
ncbi:MAG: flavin prenyltransferase UbiX [bacterium]